jgi:hypothetical protein
VKILRTLSGKTGTCGNDDARGYNVEPTPTNGCIGQRPEAWWKVGVPVGSQRTEGRQQSSYLRDSTRSIKVRQFVGVLSTSLGSEKKSDSATVCKKGKRCPFIFLSPDSDPFIFLPHINGGPRGAIITDTAKIIAIKIFQNYKGASIDRHV